MTETQLPDVGACAVEKRGYAPTPSAGALVPRPVDKEGGTSPFRFLKGWGATLSVVLLLAIVQAGRADAQPLFEEGERTPKEPPQFHFTPSLFVASVYDDNILLRSVRRESDLITRVRPGLSIAVDQARVRWLTDVNFEAEFYRDHPDLSTYDRSQSLDTRLTLRPDPRWTFELGDTFIHSRDPVGRVTIGIPPPAAGGGTGIGSGPGTAIGTGTAADLGGDLILRRSEYYRNVLSLRGAYRLTPRLTGELEGISRITEFKDPALIDVTADELRGALPYLFSSRDTVTPQYQYRNFYFRHRGHTEAHTASLRAERRFSETLTGRISGGLLLIVDRGTIRPDFLMGLGADQTYSETIVFHVDYTRDVAVVGGFAGTFATNVVSGSMTAHVTQAFDSIIAASWAYHQGLLANRSDLDTLRFRVEEQFKFTNWARVFLSYEFMKQNFHESATPDIYNNRIFAGLIFSQTYPPRP